MNTLKYTILFCILSAQVCFGAQKLVDRMVAEVDNEIITYRELEKEIEPFVEKIKQAGYSDAEEKELIAEVRARMLRNLVDEKIAEIAAKRSKVEVDEETVEQFLDNIKREQNLTTKELESALMMEGVTLEDYKNKLRQQILKKRLIDYEVRSKIVVTNEDVKKYYQDNLVKYGGDEAFEIWHITIPSGQFDENDKDEILKIFGNIKQLAEGQDNFTQISSEAGSYFNEMKVLSGNLGYFKKGDLSDSIKAVIENLNKGEVSSPLVTSRGIQIFYISDIKKKNEKDFEKAAPEIRRILYDQEVGKRFDKWIESLKQNMHITIIE
ncbi:MAG: SurA N-terminal domain-containing protein [Desulforegulaceae bacterium]|nr:SurA N-terminal domain-containing protein [Desulforegulaceae bacterium]